MIKFFKSHDPDNHFDVSDVLLQIPNDSNLDEICETFERFLKTMDKPHVLSLTNTPYLNGEQQIEQRWIMEVYLQCNPVLSMTGIESADTLYVNEFVDVDNNIN